MPETELLLYDRFKTDLRAAMKTRDVAAVKALRTLIAAVDNAGAVALPAGTPAMASSGEPAEPGDVARRPVSESEVRDLVIAEVAELTAAIETYAAAGHDDEVGRLAAQLATVSIYLD